MYMYIYGIAYFPFHSVPFSVPRFSNTRKQKPLNIGKREITRYLLLPKSAFTEKRSQSYTTSENLNLFEFGSRNKQDIEVSKERLEEQKIIKIILTNAIFERSSVANGRTLLF